MKPTLEVTFTPADFVALKQRDLSDTFCVVFDILRATTSMTTALANGAKQILPVQEISEALELRKSHPQALLAGERFGLRIGADQTGGVEFDLGNSPREFTSDRVFGKSIIMTTTNGTRALNACVGAKHVFVGSLHNLGALIATIRNETAQNLIVIGAGTFEEAAYEDTLAAGGLCDALWDRFEESDIVDSARVAREIYLKHKSDLLGGLSHARNGRRLLEKPALAGDVAFCAQCDICDFAAELKDGVVSKLKA